MLHYTSLYGIAGTYRYCFICLEGTSPTERAEIGKYASMHGGSAAARYSMRKLHSTVSRISVKSIQDLYFIEVKRKRQHAASGAIDDLPEKKRGRKLLLGEHLDEKLQLCIRKTRGGEAVTTRIVMVAARGLLLASNRNVLAEYGGLVCVSTDLGPNHC